MRIWRNGIYPLDPSGNFVHCQLKEPFPIGMLNCRRVLAVHSLLAKTTYSNFAEVEDLSSRGCRVLITKINLLVCQHCYTVYLGLSPQRASSAMVLVSCQSDSLNIVPWSKHVCFFYKGGWSSPIARGYDHSKEHSWWYEHNPSSCLILLWFPFWSFV